MQKTGGGKLFVGRLLISAILFSIVLLFVPVQEIVSEISSFRLIWLLPVLLFFHFGIFIKVLKIKILTGATGKPISIRDSLRIVYASHFFYSFIPSLDVIYMGLLGRSSGYGRAGFVVVLDRVSSITMAFGIALFALIGKSHLLNDIHPLITVCIILGFIFSLMVMGLVVSKNYLTALQKVLTCCHLSEEQWIGRKIFAIIKMADFFRGQGPTILYVLGLSLLFQISVQVLYVLICQGLGLEINVWALLFVFPIMAVAQTFPSFLGIGVRDMTFIWCLGQLSIAPDEAVAASMVQLGLIMIISLTGAGVVARGLLMNKHGAR